MDIKSGNVNTPFLISKNHHYTYGDLHRFANAFNDITYNSNGPAGILTDNRELAALLIASAWMTGKTFVPLPASATSDEIEKQITLSGNGILFCDAGTRKNAANLDITIIDAGTIPSDGKPYTPVHPEKESVFAILFTSGTSGTPKAVPITNRQLLSATESSSAKIPLAANDLWLHCLPLHHIGGVSIVLRAVIGGSGMYMLQPFDAVLVSKMITDNTSIKGVSLVPTQLKRLIEQPDFKPHDGFRAALIGGGPASASLQFEASQKIPVIFSYGMTETCAMITSTEPGCSFSSPDTDHQPAKDPATYSEANSTDQSQEAQSVSPPRTSTEPASGHTGQSTDEAVIPGCAGSVNPENKICIVDSSGSPLPPGKTGLICLKGPQVFDGYLPPDQKAFTGDGWFITGDYGWLNEKGLLYIETRRDDRIITGGENVDPEEIEASLMTLPGILNAAVIGLPDDEWGQIVTAVIVPEDGTDYSLESIRETLRSRLSAHKLPRRLELISELPVTALGKIKKNDLKRMFSPADFKASSKFD